jgi:mono/diheme cytochrome c family protein
MSLLLRASACLLCLSLVATTRIEGAGTAAQQQPAVAGTEGPGRAIFQRKCAQCHQAGMWTSLRQDRRAWESTLYRMVGRGALWTPEEINAMADYLAQIRGSTSAKATVDAPAK